MTKPTPSQIDEIKAVFSDRVGNTKQLMFNLLKIDDAITLAWQKAQSELFDLKIIKDEICQCNHSKLSHGATMLDYHGGECNQCKCNLYTWKEFIFIDLKEELRKRKVSND